MNLQLIKTLSERTKIPLTLISSHIGMSTQNLHRCIRENKIEAGVLEKIAKVFGVSVACFFDENQPGTIIGNQNQINNGLGQQILMTPDQREIESLKELLKEKERFIQHLLNQNK